MKRLIKYSCCLLMLVFSISMLPTLVRAEAITVDEEVTIDRIQLVTQQINILKSRIAQGKRELAELQQHEQQISQMALEKASKNLLDKAALDVSVSKSNLESINIELTDSQQAMGWLEKNIQEFDNQLNVLSIFGLKVTKSELANIHELRNDLNYQHKLLKLEKSRAKYLQELSTVANNSLALKKERYSKLNALLKSRKMLHIKQKQVKDELVYQEQQNYWLQQLNLHYGKLAKIDPAASEEAKAAYASTERDIFYANEKANYAYVQSLVARYTDQLQQMKIAISRSNSIGLLNEIGNQAQLLSKQVGRLVTVSKSRVNMLDKHVSYLTKKRHQIEEITFYTDKLTLLQNQYKITDASLAKLHTGLAEFRTILDRAIQSELSSRQGLPSFGLKTMLDLGKEMLLVPALTFQVIKSLSNNLYKSFQVTSTFTWGVIALMEALVLFGFFFLHQIIKRTLERPSQWRGKLNSKWLSLQWFRCNFVDIVLLSNIIGIMIYFEVPSQNYIFIIYLSLVWLIFKTLMTLARVALVETTHDSSGHDMRLYNRLKWMIIAGGVSTALTVFVHQLPLIYELKTLCARLFLFFLMIVSVLLLRSCHIIPNLIISHMESQQPYFEKSIKMLSILVPILMFGNSVIGMLGYVNLVMTVSWYEGIFLVVLIGYLILRGLLSDGMEELSRLVIQYVNNGWLWTEAFLKPIHKVLRITMFLVAWAVLFLLYGWDKQSPIVERLTRMLQYKLVNVLNTTITPINIIELCVVISIFYWTAKWTREFVYRMLASRTKDMGIRNSIAVLSQYSVVIVGVFICLKVLGINLQAIAVVASMFAFGIGLGLRDLANNFACGFLILLERPLRVGDIVSITGVEGEVIHIGSRAVTVRTWDHMELVVPNAEIFNKSFTNWTARDNTVRSVTHIKISRYDNPHEVRLIIQNVLMNYKEVLKEPAPEVFLKEMNDILIEFELRYFVNIRQVKSRTSVMSAVLMNVWDAFAKHGIKPPYPQQEIFIRNEASVVNLPLLSEQRVT